MSVLQKRLRIAGVLIALGLILELASMFWRHPLSFFLFVVLGGALLFLGILVYLHALVSFREQDSVAQSQG